MKPFFQTLKRIRGYEVYFNIDSSVHGQNPGVSNGGFLLNTLKTLFRLSRVLNRYLEMHSKWRYKICICLVILGQLKSLRNYKGFSIIFPLKFSTQLNVLRKSESSSYSSLHQFLNPKMLGFLFCM